MTTTQRRLMDCEGDGVDVQMRQPGYVRAIVNRDGNATKVEWAHDSSWRFMPAVCDERVGYLLHPVDLAVNKVLVLAGRDEPRDVLDTLQRFVDPRAVDDAVPHHGRPGGVLPRVVETGE